MLTEGLASELLNKKMREYSGAKRALVKEIYKNLDEPDVSEVREYVDRIVKTGSRSGYMMHLTQTDDVYGFYKMHQDELDEVLEKSGWFAVSPAQSGISSLYDYVIEGAYKAIDHLVKEISEEL